MDISLLKNIKMLISDVDGVMTDGRLYFSNNGDEMKSFHTLDGQGVKMLRDSGVEVALLTARQSRIVARRASELGITRLRQGAADKRAGFDDLLAECRLTAAQAGYAGDDLVDLPVLTLCGFSASVPEAPEAVRSRVHFVSRSGGGRGAVREVCEYIMQAQGTLEPAISRFLQQ